MLSLHDSGTVADHGQQSDHHGARVQIPSDCDLVRHHLLIDHRALIPSFGLHCDSGTHQKISDRQVPHLAHFHHLVPASSDHVFRKQGVYLLISVAHPNAQSVHSSDYHVFAVYERPTEAHLSSHRLYPIAVIWHCHHIDGSHQGRRQCGWFLIGCRRSMHRGTETHIAAETVAGIQSERGCKEECSQSERQKRDCAQIDWQWRTGRV
mmetsp:Transcript_44201/g.70814  ORF Transcript_44201/g.70814 Transcript_44201/m.70814 type:complete len:208 (-) Transcript_44201:616-1239(-)